MIENIDLISYHIEYLNNKSILGFDEKQHFTRAICSFAGDFYKIFPELKPELNDADGAD